ncbi:MAG TPA: hypothetical protein VLI21_17465 [Casimicrobiaceae bacterium]|nr:hypothetical protein [Casimicrobiaceae bacterium]
MIRRICLALALGIGSLGLESCYYPVAVQPGTPASFDRSWSAALGGAEDAGVQVISADPNAGIIRGTRGSIDVTVVVARQADGSVRVQFDSKGQTQQDPGLAQRFSEAYERRMGR